MSAKPEQRRKKILRRIGQRKIAVLMGGISAERDISLKSGQMVLEALIRSGVNAWGQDIRSWHDLIALGYRQPAAAVMCLHGPGGEDGSLQACLEWMKIPYSGSGVLASALAMDKARSKHIFKSCGLPIAAGIVLGRPGDSIPASLRLPVVVKPNCQGSAVGVSVVKRREQLARALALAWQFPGEVLVEKYLPGREITVGILDEQALPVIEIVPKKEFYDYEAKYTSGMSEHLIPARLPARVQGLAQRLAVAAHRALGCRGVSRVDFIVSREGRPVILEVNTIPGMTATSLLPEAARHVGISFEELSLRLVANALDQEP